MGIGSILWRLETNGGEEIYVEGGEAGSSARGGRDEGENHAHGSVYLRWK